MFPRQSPAAALKPVFLASRHALGHVSAAFNLLEVPVATDGRAARQLVTVAAVRLLFCERRQALIQMRHLAVIHHGLSRQPNVLGIRVEPIYPRLAILRDGHIVVIV